jgi:hypothetical protein
MGSLEIPAPKDLDERVRSLLGKADGLGISGDQLLRHARLLVAAQAVVADRDRIESRNRDELARVEALHYGVLASDTKAARAAIASGRIARQRVHVSASGCSKRLTRLVELLRMHYETLPFPLTAAIPIEDFEHALELIAALSNDTAPAPPTRSKLRMAKSPLSHTVAGHTFLWWRYCVKDKLDWSAMHKLARCWHLTQSEDPQTFRRQVLKVKPEIDYWGVPCILGCPAWALP